MNSARQSSESGAVSRSTGRYWITTLIVLCVLALVAYAVFSRQAGVFLGAASERAAADSSQQSGDADPARGTTKLLLFSPINPLYAAATAADWSSRGFGGLMFDQGYPPFDFTSNAYAAADAATLKAAVDQLRSAGVTDNFLKVADYYASNNKAGYRDIFNDAAWAKVLAGLETSARYAKETGLVGIVIDVEPYGGADTSFLRFYKDSGRSRKQTAAQVRQRGQQVMQAMLAVYPGMLVMLIPETAAANVDKSRYEYYDDFFYGLASVQGAADIIVGSERSYAITNLAEVTKLVDKQAASISSQRDWPLATNFALGAYPLGKSSKDKRAMYSAQDFARQLGNFSSALPKARYAWIYGPGGAWWQAAKRADYLPALPSAGAAPVPWNYRDHHAYFDTSPPDSALPSYFAATASAFGH